MSKRPLSRIAPGWWDYTTLDRDAAGRRRAADGRRPAAASPAGVSACVFYDTLEEFYLAEALEYIDGLAAGDADDTGGHLRPDRADRAAAAGGAARERPGPRPAARALLGHGRMGRGRPRGRADRLTRCPSRGPTWSCASTASAPSCACRRRTCTFPRPTSAAYSPAATRPAASSCRAGQGEVKHWAFNDPPQRKGDVQGRSRRRPRSTAS